MTPSFAFLHITTEASKTGMVIGVSVGAVSVLIILGVFSIWLLRRRRKRKQARILEEAREQELGEGGFFDEEPELEDEFERGTGPKRFRYGELAVATENFSDTQKLEEGGFGSVYRDSSRTWISMSPSRGCPRGRNRGGRSTPRR